MSEKESKTEMGGAIINDKIVGIVCPHCGMLIHLNILKSIRTYLERFNDNFKTIRENASTIDIDFVINRILKGDIHD